MNKLNLYLNQLPDFLLSQQLSILHNEVELINCLEHGVNKCLNLSDQSILINCYQANPTVFNWQHLMSQLIKTNLDFNIQHLNEITNIDSPIYTIINHHKYIFKNYPDLKWFLQKNPGNFYGFSEFTGTEKLKVLTFRSTKNKISYLTACRINSNSNAYYNNYEFEWFEDFTLNETLSNLIKLIWNIFPYNNLHFLSFEFGWANAQWQLINVSSSISLIGDTLYKIVLTINEDLQIHSTPDLNLIDKLLTAQSQNLNSFSPKKYFAF